MYETTTTTTTHYFWNDLEKGKNKEKEIAELFKKAEWIITTTSLDQGRFEDYDFIVNYKGDKEDIKIECKYDIMSARTGNVAVEISKNNNEPSGINSTKADTIIYSFPDKENYYAYDIDTLKKLINDKKYLRIVTGGQTGKTKMVLFNRDFFIKNAILVNYEFLK